MCITCGGGALLVWHGSKYWCAVPVGVVPCLSGMAAQLISEQARLLSHWILVDMSACFSLHATRAVVVLTRLSLC